MATFGIIAAAWTICFVLSWAFVHGAKKSRLAADPSQQELEDMEQMKAIEEYVKKRETRKQSKTIFGN